MASPMRGERLRVDIAQGLSTKVAGQALVGVPSTGGGR